MGNHEEKGKEQSSNQAVKIINSVKSVMNGGKDPYVVKAMERAKLRLRSRLSEINGG
ncbi:MAG: hypothetical protein GX050_07180 [Firmicutes bacterium]|nr:hypothetical protein [Bacillota bacterium]